MTPWTILGWIAVAVASVMLVVVPIAVFFILRESWRADVRMRRAEERIEDRRREVRRGVRK